MQLMHLALLALAASMAASSNTTSMVQARQEQTPPAARAWTSLMSPNDDFERIAAQDNGDCYTCGTASGDSSTAMGYVRAASERAGRARSAV